MVPVLVFAGSSGSGKTTLLEQVIKILTEDGMRISVIKHGHDFYFDKEGKDTWRMRHAGAKRIFMLCPDKNASINMREASLDKMIHTAYDSETDLIILEGYKHLDRPKIEIFRADNGKPPACANDENLLAVVTDSFDDPRLADRRLLLDINKPEQTAELVKKYVSGFSTKNFFSVITDGEKADLSEEALRKLESALKECLGSVSGEVEIKAVFPKATF